METSVETIYQRKLTPGFTSLTTLVRHYSFYSWLVARYTDAKTGQSTSIERFQHYTRRAEALYALATLHASLSETGVGGARFAKKKLQGDGGTIDFRYETDSSTPPDERYLQSSGGQFSDYVGAMLDVGLLAKAAKHNLRVPDALGRRLAACFEASVGSGGDLFLAIAKAGVVERDVLAELKCFAPSSLDLAGAEADLLRGILMGQEDTSPLGQARSASLRAILREMDRRETNGAAGGVSSEELPWIWHDEFEDSPDAIIPIWAAYHASDVLRTCYEALLRYAVQALEDYPFGISLTRLTVALAADLPEETLGDWLIGLDAGTADIPFPQLHKRILAGRPTI